VVDLLLQDKEFPEEVEEAYRCLKGGVLYIILGILIVLKYVVNCSTFY